MEGQVNFSQELKSCLTNEAADYEKIIEILEKQINQVEFIQSIEPKSNLVKLLEKLENKAYLDKIYKILEIVVNVKSTSDFHSLEFEFNKGLSILSSHHKVEEVLKLYGQLIPNKKVVSSLEQLMNVMNMCYSSSIFWNNNVMLEKCVNLVKLLSEQDKTYSLSNSFWRLNIEGLLKLQKFSLVTDLIYVYPFKLNNCESLVKSIIKGFLSYNQSVLIFDIIQKKFEGGNIKDDYNSFEAIFNLFLEEITASFQNIQESDLKYFYETILLKNKIKIKESVLEKFLIKVAFYYKDNFEKIERYLLMADTLLTQKIVEKIINEFSNSNDSFCTFMMIRLCKFNKIPIAFENLNLNSDILKKVITFLMNNSEIDLTIEGEFSHIKENDQKDNVSIVSRISKENQNYYMVSKNNSNQKLKLEEEFDKVNISEANENVHNQSSQKDKSLMSISGKTSESILDDYAIY